MGEKEKDNKSDKAKLREKNTVIAIKGPDATDSPEQWMSSVVVVTQQMAKVVALIMEEIDEKAPILREEIGRHLVMLGVSSMAYLAYWQHRHGAGWNEAT